MKLLVSFIFLIAALFAFGQSAKKVNKQLLAEFALEQQKQDSAFAIFTQTKQEFDSIRKLTNKKINGLSDQESALNRLLLKTSGLSGNLKELGVDPNFLITDYSRKDVFPRYIEVTRPIKEMMKEEVKFDKVSNRIYLDMMKRKEQNIELTKKVKEYRDYAKFNSIHQQKLESNTMQLIAFLPKLDSLAGVYQLLGNELATKKAKLLDKLDELRGNYMEKGPDGFPEAYKRVFYDAFPPTQEEMIRDVEISRSEWVDGPYDIVEAIPVEPENQEIYTYVEEPASFPGGAEKMQVFISKNLRYPEKMKEAHVSGKVFLKFIVSETGRISEVEVLKGIPNCKECDNEAVRVVKLMPNWIPGKNNGKAVRSLCHLPVRFTIE